MKRVTILRITSLSRLTVNIELMCVDLTCLSNLSVLIFQVFRHGPRTPADTYPTDPHFNQTFYPYGWGHITNVKDFSFSFLFQEFL